MNLNAKLSIIIILSVVTILSCNSNNNEYQSKYHDKLTFIKEDSLSFQYTDSLILGRIQSVTPWKQYILVEDARSMRLWVFDRQLKLVTIVGKRGRAPGEYSHSCIPIVKGDSLLLFDSRLRKVNVYDTAFQRLGEYTLPFKIAPNNIPFHYFNQHYILSGLYLGKAKSVEITKKYIHNNKSAYVLDSNFHYKTDIFPWDKLYENEQHSSFNSIASEVNFTNGSKNDFYAHQAGDYKIAHFDSSFQILKIFGLKSSNAKEPPLDEEIIKKTDNHARASVLFAQSSLYMATKYDTINNLVLSYFTTATEESFFKRDPISAKHFLQMYDAATYDCVFDGMLPGILLFIENGRMYVLTQDNVKQFTISIFKIQQK
jgi:hypothetical protein